MPGGKYLLCRNGCRKKLRKPGYCQSCKALRKLLARIHKDKQPSQERVRRDEVAKRVEIHRERTSGFSVLSRKYK